MKVLFKKSNSIDLHNYSIFINNKKYSLNDELNIDLLDNQSSFYVKTYWFKTKEYNIELNHKNCIVNIEFLISKKNYFILMSIFAVLFTMSIYFDNYLMWTIMATFSALWLAFQLYIYTFGHKQYIRTEVKYFD